MMNQLEDQVSDLRLLTSSAAIPLEGGIRRSGNSVFPLQRNNTAHSADNSAPSTRRTLSSAPDYAFQPLPTPSVTSAPPSSAPRGTKRKQDNGDGGNVGNSSARPTDAAPVKQTRSKRNRYISIACNECKRRKIKCNGETPCQRCGTLKLECLYAPNCCSGNFKDSDEFKRVTARVRHLEEQVETLFATINSPQSETLRLTPIQDRSLPHFASSPRSAISASPLQRLELAGIKSFRGTTSTGFSLEVAKNTLHNLGYSGQYGDVDRESSTAHAGLGAASTPSESVSSPFHPPLPPSKHPALPAGSPSFSDPLWEFDRDEMSRLCQLHDEEVGIMHPVVRMQSLIEHVAVLARWMENCKAGRTTYDERILVEEKTLQLKIIVCCGLVVEGHGQSDRATRLFESMENIANKRLMSDEADVSHIPYLALVAGYRFLSNDEVLSWRIMGQVARLCLELGLHRSDHVMKIENEEHRNNAITTFWTAYVLDRRWSFGTGLPYVMQDDQIDPNLPLPTHQYLAAMVTYSKVGARVWKLVPHFHSVMDCELDSSDIKKLDQEILDWYANIPEQIRIEHWSDINPMPSTTTYNLDRLRMMTRLRLNQMRLWLYTPILHTNSSIMSNIELAASAVELAQDTITYLADLNNTSNIYRKIQVFYHQFLISAVAALFLASVHAPVQFSARCRREFYMALELVRDLSAKSWVSQRLWQTIKSLKDDGRPLGLVDDEDEHAASSNPLSNVTAMAQSAVSSSAATMASGPAAHSQPGSNMSVSSTRVAGRGAPGKATVPSCGSIMINSGSPDNGAALHDEMRRLFEGFTGINEVQQSSNPGEDGQTSTAGDAHGSANSGGANVAYTASAGASVAATPAASADEVEFAPTTTATQVCEAGEAGAQPYSTFPEGIYGSFAKMF